MQRLRDLMRGTLARSLQSLADEDRLAAALPLVCGSALAAHCEVDHLEESGRLHLRVFGKEWLRSLLPIRDALQHDLGRVAGVPLTGLHFMEAGAHRVGSQGSREAASGATRRDMAGGERRRGS